MTPMYHWASRRIEAHVTICVLALLIERIAELACGEFPMTSQEPQSLFFPQGFIINRELKVQSLYTEEILEHARRSWYGNGTALHPSLGETVPKYTGYDPDGRYNWLKAPRYNGEPMEVGRSQGLWIGGSLRCRLNDLCAMRFPQVDRGSTPCRNRTAKFAGE